MPEQDVRLRLLVEAVNRAGRELNSVATGLNRIGDRAAQANAKTRQFATQGSASMRKLMTASQKLEGTFTRISAASDKMVSVGMKMGLVGAGMAAAVALPVKTAASFERSMDRTIAVTQGTEAEFKNMIQTAKELGRTTRYTAVEVSEGMKFLGMAGMDAKKVMDAIEPSLLLAAAGGLELAEAADIATNVLAQFQLPVENLTHVTDVLANTAMSANTDVRQLAEAMVYSGPAAAAAGVKVEEVAGVLGTLANNGIRASMAGTTLRSMLIALSNPTKQAQDALNQLGIEIAYTEDGTLDLIETMDRLGKANMSLGQATDIFRRTAASGAIAMSKQADSADRLTEANYRADGATQRMYETVEKNLIGSLIRWKSAVEGLLDVLGSPFLTPLTNIVDKLTEFTTATANWAEKNSTFTTILLVGVGALGAFLAALGAVLIPLGLFGSLLGVSGGGLAKMLGWIPKLVTAIAGLRVGIAAAAAATGALAAAFKGFVVFAAGWGVVKIIQLGKEIWNVVKAIRTKRRALQNTETALAQHAATVQKFNWETNNSAKSIEEVSALMKEQGWHLDKTTNEFKKYNKEVEKTGKPKPKPKPTEDEIRAARERQAAILRIQSTTEDMRIAAMEEGHEKFVALMEKEIADFTASEDAKKATAEVAEAYKAAIRAKYQTQEAGWREELSEQALQETIKYEEEQIRIAERAAEQRLRVERRFQEELSGLQTEVALGEVPEWDVATRGDVETQALAAQLSARLEYYRQYVLDKQQLDEMEALHKQLLAQRTAEVERQIEETRLAMYRTSYSALESLMSDLYEASDKKVRVFFYMQKAAAIAQAIVDTQIAATKALGDPAVSTTHRMINAKLIQLAGMARVALITAQTIRGYSEGGRVEGPSGKDRVLAKLTKDEVVMPVEAVRHYGMGVMEAMRRRILVLQDAAVPSFSMPAPRGRYQTGGVVRHGVEEGAKDVQQVPTEITIANITDPRAIDEFFASARGQTAVINAISARSDTIKRVLR